MATESHHELLDVDENGHTALRRWRYRRYGKSAHSGKAAARFFGVSTATYYRIETGGCRKIETANRIVRKTGGELRYRDLIPGFNPDFA